jgi:hypothetical protein
MYWNIPRGLLAVGSTLLIYAVTLFAWAWLWLDEADHRPRTSLRAGGLGVIGVILLGVLLALWDGGRPSQ